MNSNIAQAIESPSCSFLSDFSIAATVVDNDTNSGTYKTRIRYSGEYMGYEMTVNTKFGKKEGKGIVNYPDGKTFMELTFVNDLGEGPIVKKDRLGQTILRGVLKHGSECGLFEELYNGDLVWQGFYRNGKRYSTLEESEDQEGFYIEYNLDGDVLSVSEYDENWMKNGTCYEYEEGVLKRECVYENGVKRVVREFTDEELMRLYGDNGDVISDEDMRDGYVDQTEVEGMKGFYQEKNENGDLLSVSEYDENWMKNGRCYEFEEGYLKREWLYEHGMKKRVIFEFTDEGLMRLYDDSGDVVYEGDYGGDMVKGFVIKSGMEGFYARMNENRDALCISEYDENWMKNGRYFEVEPNTGFLKRECVYEHGVMKRIVREFNENGSMIEYDMTGKRVYEGDFVGDMKNGFVREGKGSEFGVDGKNAVYVGEWKNGLREGKGSEFKDCFPVYIGEWKNGMRHGEGKELNQNGEVISGRWVRGFLSSTIDHYVTEQVSSLPVSYTFVTPESNSRPRYRPRFKPVRNTTSKSVSTTSKRSPPSAPEHRVSSGSKNSQPSAPKRCYRKKPVTNSSSKSDSKPKRFPLSTPKHARRPDSNPKQSPGSKPIPRPEAKPKQSVVPKTAPSQKFKSKPASMTKPAPKNSRPAQNGYNKPKPTPESRQKPVTKPKSSSTQESKSRQTTKPKPTSSHVSKPKHPVQKTKPNH